LRRNKLIVVLPYHVSRVVSESWEVNNDNESITNTNTNVGLIPRHGINKTTSNEYNVSSTATGRNHRRQRLKYKRSDDSSSEDDDGDNYHHGRQRHRRHHYNNNRSSKNKSNSRISKCIQSRSTQILVLSKFGLFSFSFGAPDQTGVVRC
jgi:hypothetical protein